jgi:osmotically-inducible protein OsmY
MFTLVLAGALCGCADYHAYEKCGDKGCPGDAKITAEVKQALARHPDLEGTDTVYVETVNHVVYLTGIVDSGLQREAAESLAHKASGVTAVVDNISVSK